MQSPPFSLGARLIYLFSLISFNPKPPLFSVSMGGEEKPRRAAPEARGGSLAVPAQVGDTRLRLFSLKSNFS